jgi:hypothetical protein
VTREINIGDIWERKVKLDDGYDVVQIRGLIDNAGFAPDEWTLGAWPDDCSVPVIQSVGSGITDHCTLVRSGDPEQSEWENDLDN